MNKAIFVNGLWLILTVAPLKIADYLLHFLKDY